MRENLVPCPAWERLIQLQAADALDADARRRLEAHLTQCPGCRAFSIAARRLAESLHHLAQSCEDQPVPVNLERRWRCALRQPRPSTRLRALVLETARLIGGCLPGGRTAWVSVAVCWLLVGLLRISAPGVEGPVSRSIVLPLGQVLSVLRTGPPPLWTMPVAVPPTGVDLPQQPSNHGPAAVDRHPTDLV